MSMRYKSVRLTIEELHEVKHLMGGVLTLLSFWALLSLDMNSAILIAVAMLAVGFSLVRPAAVSRIPAVTWRVVTPLLVLFVGADVLLHLPEFIPSLVRMVALLLLYRNLSPRRQREDLQLILLCLFCLIMSGVMTVSLLFALQILLFTPMAMALLFVICLLDRGKQTQSHEITWKQFSWGRLIRRVMRVLDWRVLALGSIMFGFVVFVSTLLFILTPRFNLDQAIPFLSVETQPMTGFSEEVKLGDVSEVQNDNAVAIRIDLPSIEAIETQPYWRMMVLDRYVSGMFKMSDGLKNYRFREPMTVREMRPDPPTVGALRPDLWTFYVEGGISKYLPVPGDYSVLRFQVPQKIEWFKEPHLYSLDKVTQSVFSYQIEGMQFNARFSAGRRELDALTDAKTSGALEIPEYPYTSLELGLRQDDRQALATINRSILDGRSPSSLTVSDYSRDVTEWLRENFEYSLSPDGQVLFPNAENAADPVVNWLESGSQGHCELFAGAFVLLARDAGYPARLVVGFSGGSWNSVEDYFVIRNRDAHAWVEIFDQASKEWLRVDPTPGSGSSDPAVLLSNSLQFETGWGAWIDSLRIQWYRRIVNFEQKDQIELAMSLKDRVQEFSKEFTKKMKAAAAQFKEWVSQPLSGGSLIRFCILFACILTFWMLWKARFVVLDLIFRLLRKPKALDPVRRQASDYLKRIQRKHGANFQPDLKLELQALRFGPMSAPQEAKATFAMAKRILRSREKNLLNR